MKPEILAPAGDMSSFLAALAAGADAVYLGLKHFTARMQADNFSLTELSRMARLAHGEGRRLYVAVNGLLKPGDADAALRLAARLERDVRPDALIVQDSGMPELARQAGFSGEIHFSTLANVTHPAALRAARKAGASRVILPRELSVDEIRAMGDACPADMELECFVHGALCFCVSGRCWWSSFLGGKSGLRGRCVQPCRRRYARGNPGGGEERWFSCRDFSVDVLAKILLGVSKLRAWKIEGRKKGPHYVFYTVSAYRLLRDNPGDAQAGKTALGILDMALGRAVCRARFLPQRQGSPTAPGEFTASGLLAGRTGFGRDGKPFIKTRLELLPGDYLRIGFEDEKRHSTLPVTRRVPKAGSLSLKVAGHKTPEAGTPVFLIDRREPELAALLGEWGKRLEGCAEAAPAPVNVALRLPAPCGPRRLPDMFLRAALPRGKETRCGKGITALWLSPGTARGITRTVAPRVSWWLPPVIWPDEEEQMLRLIREVARKGARRFVCNAPWQIDLFGGEENEFLAGPFCNTANAASVAALARMGFGGAFVSPELPAGDISALPRQSCLPLGIVLNGHWPVGIARHSPSGVKNDEIFHSPKKEIFWVRTYGQNLWIYSDRFLDLTAKRRELEAAGYAFFVHMPENLPSRLRENGRASSFNWDVALL
jgi:putative protease